MSLYYAAHVTIAAPLAAERAKLMSTLGAAESFAPSSGDTLTGRGANSVELIRRMQRLIQELKKNSFTLRRYQVEDTMVDSRNKDVYGLLP